MASLSVVVTTRNRPEALRICLGALVNKIEAVNEIIVADAGSDKGSAEYLREVKGIRLIREDRPLGQAAGLNRVLDTVSTDYFCWLSDDNVLREGMLDLAAGILYRNTDIGMVALKVKDATGPYMEAPYLGGLWESGVLNCNQGMVRTGLLRDLGGFDEELRDYGIDADLTTRVLLAGFKVVYTRPVAIDHYRDHGNDSWLDPESRQARRRAAKELYCRKHATLISLTGGACPSPYRDGLKHLLVRLLAVCRRSAGRYGSYTEARLGLNMRDLANMLRCRYISLRRELSLSSEPYYLVQEIPASIRKKFPEGAL